MSAVAGLGRRVAAVFEHALHLHLHGYDNPPARTVPAAVDWPEWSHYKPPGTDD